MNNDKIDEYFNNLRNGFPNSEEFPIEPDSLFPRLEAITNNFINQLMQSPDDFGLRSKTEISNVVSKRLDLLVGQIKSIFLRHPFWNDEQKLNAGGHLAEKHKQLVDGLIIRIRM